MGDERRSKSKLTLLGGGSDNHWQSSDEKFTYMCKQTANDWLVQVVA